VASSTRSNAGSTNTGRLFVQLKGREERDATADQVIARLRGPLSTVPGAVMYLQAVQDLQVEGVGRQQAGRWKLPQLCAECRNDLLGSVLRQRLSSN
jgi:multidrug efflux pump subunit AcrB